MELKYRDNEGDVRIWVEGGSDAEVDALAKRFDDAADDRALAEKLIAMDDSWANQDLEDRIHELERDGDSEIQRQRNRASRMALLAGIGWSCWFIAMLSLWRVAK